MAVDVEELNFNQIIADNSIICNVCRYRSYDLGFEMVPCARCKYFVHQACYGIEDYPGEKWLCDTCALGIEPDCGLCPIKGGAMKPTQFGNQWSHVSCALWIPEVSIDCVDRMEPIAKLCRIPQSRWDDVCTLCKIKVGACIQCSVKRCKTAFHVTCAFKYGLEMRAIIGEPDTEEEVVLKSYCKKHRRTKRHYNKFFP